MNKARKKSIQRTSGRDNTSPQVGPSREPYAAFKAENEVQIGKHWGPEFDPSVENLDGFCYLDLMRRQDRKQK